MRKPSESYLKLKKATDKILVTESIAELAGEFVVASAGPDLESLLPGKGSGAALSQNEQIISE